mgnify:CR=1 FL=1
MSNGTRHTSSCTLRGPVSPVLPSQWFSGLFLALRTPTGMLFKAPGLFLATKTVQGCGTPLQAFIDVAQERLRPIFGPKNVWPSRKSDNGLV